MLLLDFLYCFRRFLVGSKFKKHQFFDTCNIPTFLLVARRFSQPGFGRSGGVGDKIISFNGLIHYDNKFI